LVLKVLDSSWVLRVAAVIYVGATVLSFAIPRAGKIAPDETAEERAALNMPSIVAAARAMGFVRGVVGFMTFFGAFLLKSNKENAAVFGLLIAASAAGNLFGTSIAPLLRRKVREEWILVAVITIPALLLIIAARRYSIPILCVAAATIAASAACGRLAFDSLVQRDATDAARGRAFARFETRFQLVWVAGGVIAVLFPSNGRAGIFVVALVMLFAGLAYLGAVRRGDALPLSEPRS
jgi:hypothetical protein